MGILKPMMRASHTRLTARYEVITDKARWDLATHINIVIGTLDLIVGRHIPEFYEAWEKINT